MNESIPEQIMNNPGFWNSLSPARKEIVRQVFLDIGQPMSSLPEDELDIYRKVAKRYRAEVIEPAEKLRQEMEAICPSCQRINNHTSECEIRGPKAERLLIANILDAVDTMINYYHSNRDETAFHIPSAYVDRLVKTRNAANAYWYGKDRVKR